MANDVSIATGSPTVGTAAGKVRGVGSNGISASTWAPFARKRADALKACASNRPAGLSIATPDEMSSRLYS